MKLENNQNLVLYKDKIQNDYKKKFSSKIQDIESLIKNYNLEEKNKTLEIQKRNANLICSLYPNFDSSVIMSEGSAISCKNMHFSELKHLKLFKK